MAPEAPARRRGRPPRISRGAILDAASACSLRNGPRGITMQEVARELGVDPAALYWHVESKRELLQALAARAAAELAIPPLRNGPWQEACFQACQALREQIRRNPDLGILDGDWELLAPFNARATGLLARVLARGPMSDDQILRVSQVLLYQITSVGRLEAALPYAPADQIIDYNRQVRDSLPEGQGPVWNRVVGRPAEEAFDAIFGEGVRAILAGIAPESSGARAPSSR